jgi:hypothetical protein
MSITEREGKRHSEGLRVRGGIILKYILNMAKGVDQIQLLWTGSSGGMPFVLIYLMMLSNTH